MKRLSIRCICLCIAAVTALSASSAVRAFGNGPHWTIGRAIIATGRPTMPSSPALHLKLSLRNTGSPGRMPVSIYGRWTAAAEHAGQRGVRGDGTPVHPTWRGSGSGTHAAGQPDTPGRWSTATGMPGAAPRPGMGWNGAAPSASAGEMPAGMRLLGRYMREVSLTNTAILDIPLPTRRRRSERRLEIEVMSGSTVTDHQFINAARP